MINGLSALTGLSAVFGGALSPPLDSLALWLRSDAGLFQDPTGVSGASATNDPVGLWKDQSGLARNFSSSLTRRPLVLNGAKNNLPAVRFDGTNDALSGVFSLAQPVTIFAAVRQVTWTDGDYFWDGASLNTMILRQRTATPNLGIFGGADNINNSGLPVNTFGVLKCVYNGASSEFSVNGLPAQTGSIGAASPGGMVLGDNVSAMNPANYDLGELLVYAGDLSLQKDQQAVDYLKQRWGV